MFSTHPPIVGPYSRLGGNHPGPAIFYALALPHRLLGGHAWTLMVGAALVNLLSLALVVRIAGGRARTGLAALVAGLTVACVWGLGVEHLRDAWNPRLPVLPFLLASIATWAVVIGSRRALPVALVAASFCAQCQVGYVGLAALLAAWCAFGVWRHRADWPSWRGPVLAAAALAGIMWVAPVGQQVLGERGNLTRIIDEARDTGEPQYGWTGVENLLLPHLGPTPAWFRATADDPFELRGRQGLTWPPLGLLAFAGGLIVASRRKDREALALLLVTASLWVVGALSISELSGVPAPYLYRWVRPLGVLLWVAALWPLGRAVGARWRRTSAGNVDPRLARAAPIAAIAVVGALAVGVAASEVATPFEEYRERYRQASTLAERAVAAVRREGLAGTIEVRYSDSAVFVAPAVVGELERAGHRVAVDAGQGTVWGDHRRPAGDRSGAILIVTDDLRTLRQVEALERVASVDMLTPEQRRTYAELTVSSERCDAVARAEPESEPSPDLASERRQCRQRSELARLDRTVHILLGPKEGAPGPP